MTQNEKSGKLAKQRIFHYAECLQLPIFKPEITIRLSMGKNHFSQTGENEFQKCSILQKQNYSLNFQISN